MGTKPTFRRPRRRQQKRSPGLGSRRIAVVGLNGIGRRVATLLAASGVGALLLVDHRTVTRRDQRREGYNYDDIGHMKAHAAAHACHEINPRMEVNTHTDRSELDFSGVDVVVVCSGQHRQQDDQTEATALVHLVQPGSEGGQARIECLPAAQPVLPTMPAPALASIIAGLAVEEAGRLLGAEPRLRGTRRIDLQGVTIRVATHP